MSRVASIRAIRDGRALPLGAAIDRFLASGDVAPSSVRVYRLTLEALIEDFGADVDVATVRRAELERFLHARWGDAAPAT
jgi:hypothetical protein